MIIPAAPDNLYAIGGTVRFLLCVLSAPAALSAACIPHAIPAKTIAIYTALFIFGHKDTTKIWNTQDFDRKIFLCSLARHLMPDDFSSILPAFMSRSQTVPVLSSFPAPRDSAEMCFLRIPRDRIPQ
jgi:hypothetical protein